MRYRRRDDVHFTALPDGGLALLDTKRSVFHGCNAVGRRIWELLEQPRTREELIAALLEEYAVEEQRCEREVDDFLAQLRSQELVEPCGP